MNKRWQMMNREAGGRCIAPYGRACAILCVAICTALAWFLFTPLHSDAQEVLEDTVFCMGTSTEDDTARQWAYLLWHTDDQFLVRDKKFAIYAKEGDAGSIDSYELQGIALLQTDPLIIQALLNRASQIGDDLVKLEERIDGLFVQVMPEGNLTLPEKISAVIRGSLEDPEQFGNLVMLGRLHPGINLCIGYGHAERIADTGKTTFEVREHDLASGTDLGVIGRVTVEAGSPTVLPAPGAPVVVPEKSGKGDLNVKLRWSTPNALRRLTLLNYGFNVYRMDRDYAEEQGFHAVPPTNTIIASLAETNGFVKRVIDLPVLKSKDFTAANVDNFVSDPSTVFLADDNGRYRAGGVAFEDGQQFYYFVTALDVLGRDGLVSLGGLATVCDRLPPDAPRGLVVENDYSYDGGTDTTKQVLKVTWEQHTNTVQDTVTAYYVYRWVVMSDINKFAPNPLINQIAGPILHVPGQKFNSYVDDGAGSPQMPADAGKTFWYTVRAADDSVCDGGNLSANSAPAFGVLRDREGPGRPDGGVSILCCRPVVRPEEWQDDRDPLSGDPAFAHYLLTCARHDPSIRWVEFYAFNTGSPTNRVGRFYYQGKEEKLEVRWAVDRERAIQAEAVPIYARAGDSDGRVSEFSVIQTEGVPKRTTIRIVQFNAFQSCERSFFRERPDRRWPSHTPQPGGGGGSVTGIDITILLTPGTKEYKLYRRIDFGALTLIKQGPADFDDVTQITVTDDSMPASSAFVCYYGQLFDEHGNASPLALLTSCFGIKMPVAKPLLSPLSSVGDLSSPQMNILWFCPPYGVERFEVWIATDVGNPPTDISVELSPQIGPIQEDLPVVIEGTILTNDYAVYRTPILGPGFGQGAQFSISANIELGKTYTVFIKPVGKDGTPATDDRNSNAEQFVWTEKVQMGPMVPWPARPLPPIDNAFHPKLQAERLPDWLFSGIGIRIGEASSRFTQEEPPWTLDGHINPVEHLYTNSAGEALFPVAVYRVQSPNATFPQVSEDVVQVSPLMEQIAHAFDFSPDIGNITTIHDPFIVVGPGAAGANIPHPIYLIDTQPVVGDAEYIYLLVRLGEDKEILDVITTNPVFVDPVK